MKKVIRPAGLLVFLTMIVLMAAFWFLAAGWLVKSAVEKGGSAAIGAKVELDGVALSLSPFGVALMNIQVADPDSPMNNLIQIDTVRAQLDLTKLLMGQLIIENLEAQKVQLGTARSSSGALTTPENGKPAEPVAPMKLGKNVDFSALRSSLPSVDELLAREPLSTIELSEDFEKNLISRRDRIAQQLEALPNKEVLKSYQQRIDEITSGKVTSVEDFKRRQKALRELKQEIRRDKTALLSVKEEISETRMVLGSQLSQLRAAPAQDIAKIKEKYTLAESNLANFGGLLFGEQTQRWIAKAEPWFERLEQLSQSDEKPLSPPRGEGRLVHFPAPERLPDLLIRQSRVSIETDRGTVVVHISDITHQPEQLDRPMKLALESHQLADIEELEIQGIFDHRNRNESKDELTWTVTGWRLNNVQLVDRTDMVITLSRATMEMVGQVVVVNGLLSGDVDTHFTNAKWQGEGGKDILRLLDDIDTFSISTDLRGPSLSPAISFRSDLDERLKANVSLKLQQRQEILEKQLTARLDERVAEVVAPYQEQLDTLRQYEDQINQKVVSADKLLKAEVSHVLNEKEEELKSRLKERLNSLRKP